MFVRKLSFTKILNLLKLYFNYYFSILFKTSKRFAYPTSISIEPTTTCNLQCPECPAGLRAFTRKTGNISTELYTKIINEFAPYLTNLILYFQGEPYLHTEFFSMINHASVKKKIYTTTSTNGHFLSIGNAKKTVVSGLDKIIISIDGTTQEIYEQYRKNGELETVLQGVKNLVSMKKELKSKTPFVVVQFLVLGTNEHQINDIKKLTKEIGVNKLELKTAQIYDYKNGNLLIPKNQKYSRYQLSKNGTYSIKNMLKNRCERLWNSTVITWNGDVLPCCFDKDAKYKFGNLQNSTFKEINNNKLYQNFRKQLQKSRKNIDICRNCTEGLLKK